MFKLTLTLRQALMALALAVTSLAAQAGVIPTYKVSINTAVATGTSGYLDFSFMQNLGGPGAQATISNLAGALNGIDHSVDAGTVGNPGAGIYTMLNDNSYLSMMADFGGVFSFDLAFDGDFLGTEGLDISRFAVAALNDAFTSIGGADFAVTFDLYPMIGGANAFVEFGADAGLARVDAIPEPSELLLMLTGLALLGLFARRRGAP